LLQRCKRYARRPSTDAAFADADWYALLTEAQDDAFEDIASRSPNALYSAPVQLTTADSGKTYTFGTDEASANLYAMGHMEIYPDLASIPDRPLLPGKDYMLEGNKIRIPSNLTVTFSAGPYARFVSRPGIIDGSTQPTFPKPGRMMLVYKALEKWASRPGSGTDPEYWGKQYDEQFTRFLTDLRTQFNMGTLDVMGWSVAAWWRSMH
jgi:hypothetical protein